MCRNNSGEQGRAMCHPQGDLGGSEVPPRGLLTKTGGLRGGDAQIGGRGAAGRVDLCVTLTMSGQGMLQP